MKHLYREYSRNNLLVNVTRLKMYFSDGGQVCDLAYEMFDCVSDKIDQVSIC